jgi:hypothetical protein
MHEGQLQERASSGWIGWRGQGIQPQRWAHIRKASTQPHLSHTHSHTPSWLTNHTDTPLTHASPGPPLAPTSRRHHKGEVTTRPEPGVRPSITLHAAAAVPAPPSSVNLQPICPPCQDRPAGLEGSTPEDTVSRSRAAPLKWPFALPYTTAGGQSPGGAPRATPGLVHALPSPAAAAPWHPPALWQCQGTAATATHTTLQRPGRAARSTPAGPRGQEGSSCMLTSNSSLLTPWPPLQKNTAPGPTTTLPTAHHAQHNDCQQCPTTLHVNGIMCQSAQSMVARHE